MSQYLWSLFGGEIDQHNNWHEQSEHPTEEVHPLLFTKDYLNYKGLVGKVNSRHHQTMSAKNNRPADLDIVAYASPKKGEDKYYPSIVEIFKHKIKKIYGTQFHPKSLGRYTVMYN